MSSEDDQSTSSEQEQDSGEEHTRETIKPASHPSKQQHIDTSKYGDGTINYRTWLAKKRRERQLQEIVNKKPTRKSRRIKRPPPKRAPKSKKRKLSDDDDTARDEHSEELEVLDDSEDEARVKAAEALEELKQSEKEEQLREQQIREAVEQEARRTQMSFADLVWNGLTNTAKISDELLGYDGSFGAHVAQNRALRQITQEWAGTQQVTKKTINKYAGWGICGILLMEYMSYRGITFSLFDAPAREEHDEEQQQNKRM